MNCRIDTRLCSPTYLNLIPFRLPEIQITAPVASTMTARHGYQTSRIVNNSGTVSDLIVANPSTTQTLTVSSLNALIGGIWWRHSIGMLPTAN